MNCTDARRTHRCSPWTPDDLLLGPCGTADVARDTDSEGLVFSLLALPRTSRFTLWALVFSPVTYPSGWFRLRAVQIKDCPPLGICTAPSPARPELWRGLLVLLWMTYWTKTSSVWRVMPDNAHTMWVQCHFFHGSNPELHHSPDKVNPPHPHP